MGLRECIEELEDIVAELRNNAGWKDAARKWAREEGIPEDQMLAIWRRAVGPCHWTTAEQLCALSEEVSRAKAQG